MSSDCEFSIRMVERPVHGTTSRLRPILLWAILGLLPTGSAGEIETIRVWPDRPPGETKELPPEKDIFQTDDPLVGGRPIIKLTNVSTPTLSVYRPPAERNTGAAVIICPGGGHHILAFDHEGTEVAQWLNTFGVSGIVLKYRVPTRNPDRRWEAAVQDAQRAVRVVRNHADDLTIDPQRIGILGFSAGGETAGLTAILHAQRQYPAEDAIDQLDGRPDFAVLVYPAGFCDQQQPWQLSQHFQVDQSTPPMFFVHAFDDDVPVSNSVLLFRELQKHGVPAELHAYARGGHGFGMRTTGHPCDRWPQRCQEWLMDQGWLKSRD